MMRKMLQLMLVLALIIVSVLATNPALAETELKAQIEQCKGEIEATRKLLIIQ